VVQSWEEYKAEVQALNDDPEIGTIYPVALLLKDGRGNTYTPPDIFRWTSENSRKPAIALNYEFTAMGLFGGAAVDFEAMGRQAGAMVLRILKGKKAGEIPIEDAARYALVFNLDQARHLGIDIPEDILLAADEIVSTRRR
jgi:putative tryptophan/tyrosine transport system substrate-binding protein